MFRKNTRYCVLCCLGITILGSVDSRLIAAPRSKPGSLARAVETLAQSVTSLLKKKRTNVVRIDKIRCPGDDQSLRKLIELKLNAESIGVNMQGKQKFVKVDPEATWGLSVEMRVEKLGGAFIGRLDGSVKNELGLSAGKFRMFIDDEDDLDQLLGR